MLYRQKIVSDDGAYIAFACFKIMRHGSPLSPRSVRSVLYILREL